jgi:hypothetical protein
MLWSAGILNAELNTEKEESTENTEKKKMNVKGEASRVEHKFDLCALCVLCVFLV